MRFRTVIVLIGLSLAANACGGGGGGGAASSLPPGVTPTPTSAPPSATLGDVRGVGTFSASPAIAYDDDDRVLFVAQGRTFSANLAASAIALPAADQSRYVTAAVYARATHALYFSGSSTLYRATLSGTVSTLATGFSNITGIAVDSQGSAYVVDGDHVSSAVNGVAHMLTPAGTLNTTQTGISLGTPQIAFDSHDGALYVTDPFNTQVKRVTTGGAITTVAGSCVPYSGGGIQSCLQIAAAGTGASARLAAPSGIVYDANADVFYVSDSVGNVVWSMTPGGTTSIVAGYGAYGWSPGNGRFAVILAPVNLALSGVDGQLYMNQVDQFGGTSTLASYATVGTPPPQRTFPALEFTTPTQPSFPQNLAVAPDGTAWMTEPFANRLGHLTTTGITEVALPAGTTSPFQLTVDGAGTAWTTASVTTGLAALTGAAVARVSADGTTKAYPFTPSGIPPQLGGITIGPDGNPWFGYFVYGNPSIVSIKTIDRTSGAVSDYPQPTARVGALASGPDGNLWFNTFTNNVNAVSRLSMSGQLVGQPIPVSRSVALMTANPVDHGMWFTDSAVMLGRLDQNGTETDTMLCSDCGGPPDPAGLAAAPDGTIWFTETNPGRLAHRNADGTITRYALPDPGPSGIGVRGDGKIWVTSSYGAMLFDPAAYDAAAIPHPVGNAVRRAPLVSSRTALYGSRRGGLPTRDTAPRIGEPANVAR